MVSLLLLTASLAAGSGPHTPPAPVVVGACSMAGPECCGPVCACAPCAGPRLRDRLANLLRRDRGCSCCSGCTCGCKCQGLPCATVEPATYAPVTISLETKPRPTVAEAPKPAPSEPARVVSAPQPAGQIKEQYRAKIGASPDYSRITGQLFYVHADGGLWVVRYAPIDQEDRYGGSVVLAPAVSMMNHREGDLVRVRGEILHEQRASKRLGGPLYRTTGVELVERAGP